MSRGTALVLALLIAGCGKDKAAPGGWDPGPAPEWKKPAVATLPPPATGQLRIEYFDLDVAAPEGARVEVDFGEAALLAGACMVLFTADGPELDLDAAIAKTSAKTVTRKEATADGWILAYTAPDGFSHIDRKLSWVRRQVGAMRVDCRGSDNKVDLTDCVAATCASLTAVPGGSAETPFPDGEPVVETSQSGGEDGAMRGETRIWRDGTVHLLGWGCPRWRGVVGKIEPARVDAMLARIEAVGFTRLTFDDLTHECCDCVGDSLTLNTGGKSISFNQTACGGKGNTAFEQALSAVHATAGANPCD